MKYDLSAILVIAAALTGCTTAIKAPDNAAALPRSLYVLVERNQSLPTEFVTVLQSETQKRLPGVDVKIDQGQVDDQALAVAEWVVVVRATRIKPDYSFKPSENSTVNGLVDCLAGSGVGPGVIMTPCEYSKNNDVLEASVRDASSKTVKTYVARQQEEGWFWVLPVSAITSLWTESDQQQVWREQIDRLYDKMLADNVFNGTLSAVASQE